MGPLNISNDFGYLLPYNVIRSVTILHAKNAYGFVHMQFGLHSSHEYGTNGKKLRFSSFKLDQLQSSAVPPEVVTAFSLSQPLVG